MGLDLIRAGAGEGGGSGKGDQGTHAADDADVAVRAFEVRALLCWFVGRVSRETCKALGVWGCTERGGASVRRGRKNTDVQLEMGLHIGSSQQATIIGIRRPTHRDRHRLIARLHLAQVAYPLQLLPHRVPAGAHLPKAMRRFQRDRSGPHSRGDHGDGKAGPFLTATA